MKVSLNTIRSLNKRDGCAEDIAPQGIGDLIEKIGAQLAAVESTADIGKKYQGIIIAKIISCDPHTDADKLKVCTIDDGGVAPSVNRGEDGYVQVVCGAPNVRAGLTVVWLPPGTTVPESFDKDPFVLEARDLRGVISNGMLASAKELSLGDNHDGILEIDENIMPGTVFAEYFNLAGDIIIELENKMFTHRPDCFGFLGVARELAGIQGMPFKSPAWYTVQPEFPGLEATELPLEVMNEIPDLAPRFTAVAMADVMVKPSPVWLQIELSKVGLRPINNIVDYTNFFMLKTGQPLHAYDYDKLTALNGGAAKLVIRKPRKDEKIKLLNGKVVQPFANAILIATDKQPIGIGGVMGGSETEVDENTKNIILECANFDMYTIRRTAMANGLFTDAVTRFNKGQSPLQNLAVLARMVDEIRKFAGGKVASKVIDDNHLSQEVIHRGSVYPPITVSTEFINERLGSKLTTDEIAALLQNVEFRVTITDTELVVMVPFWRTDIEIPEDIVEEVGRLYGYDHLLLQLPKRDLTPAKPDKLISLKSEIRETLAKAGANELLTYSFIHGELIDKVGQDREKAYKLSNALSPELQYYRLSLTPSLLDKVHPNIKAGYDEFAMFELGKSHMKGEADPNEPGVPKEVNALGFVAASNSKLAAGSGAPFYVAKKYLVSLLDHFNARLSVVFEPLAAADLHQNPWLGQMVVPFEPQRAAILRDDQNRVWGVVGEYTATVKKALKLPDNCAGFEIDPTLLLKTAKTTSYAPLPKFPKVQQDITLKVPAATPFQAVQGLLEELLLVRQDLRATLNPLDIYQGTDDPEHKNLSFRFTVASYDKTLKSEEVNAMLDQAAQELHEQLGAERS